MLSRREKLGWVSVALAVLGFLLVFALLVYATLVSPSGAGFLLLGVAAGAAEMLALLLGIGTRDLLPSKIGIGSAVIMLVVLGIMLLVKAIVPAS